VIEAEKAHFPIGLMCRVLGVSRSGFYAWRARPRPGPRALRDTELRSRIRDIHAKSRGTYGSPRVHAQLRKDDVRAGKARVERLMREDGLRGKVKRRFRVTTDSEHVLPVAPNILDRQFSVEGPDQVWVGDITYIPLATGFLFLAVILDLFSRRVVGWALADHLRTELVLDALEVALGARVPAPDMLHHSDRGCQYASASYREKLAALGIRVSMSRRGCCLDKGYASHCTAFARFGGSSEKRRRFDNLLPCFLAGGLSPGCSYRHSFLSLYA
jgi:transposase InsO family protein